MKKWVFVIILLLFSTLLFTHEAHGLSTKFADVLLSGMKPGMVYSIKAEKGLTYKVLNNSNEAKNVEVVIEKPSSRQLKSGYEVIPDISWIKVHPQTFHLKPGESTDCDIILSIPADEKYTNRHFQTMLITQTVAEPDARGVAISYALASRLRFSTGPTPEKVMSEYRKKVLEALKIDLTPLSLFVSEVSVGEVVRLDGDEFSTLQMINRGKEDYKVEFELAKNHKMYGLAKDYEPIPEEIKVKFKKRKVRSRKRSINDVIMELKIPDKEEFYGKSFAFVVIAKIILENFPVELFARVYFETTAKSGMKDE